MWFLLLSVALAGPGNLNETRVAVETVREMEADGIVASEDADQKVEEVLEAATPDGMPVLTEADLEAAPVETAAAAGWLTFGNLMRAALGVATAVFVVVLVGALWPLLRAIPLVVYEVLAYANVAAAVAYLPVSLDARGLLGAVAFSGLVGFSVGRRDKAQSPVLLSILVALVSMVAAVLSASTWPGYVAVLGLLGALGFSAAVVPFGYVFGFDREDDLFNATTAGVLISLAGIFVPSTTPVVSLLLPGACFFGPFVGLLGLLIMSSRYYARTTGKYFLTNLLFGVVAVTLLLLGSVYDAGAVQEVAGTYVVLWMAEKLTDVPAEGALQWSLVGILGCTLGWFGLEYVMQNVAVFAPFLPGL